MTLDDRPAFDGKRADYVFPAFSWVVRGDQPFSGSSEHSPATPSVLRAALVPVSARAPVPTHTAAPVAGLL